MRYKATSKKDAIILAYVLKYPPGYDGPIEKPTETLRHVALFANKPQDGLGMIIGVDPRFADGQVQSKEGFSYVPISGVGADFFREHFGFLTIERSSIPD